MGELVKEIQLTEDQAIGMGGSLSACALAFPPIGWTQEGPVKKEL